MRTIDLFLRCYVEKEQNLWVAACVDLCLAAQAETQEEAVRKLNLQISDYVVEALSSDRHTKALLTRKAPWPQVLKFHWLNFAGKYKFINESQARVFDSILPLHPSCAMSSPTDRPKIIWKNI